jgi:phospholipid transport system substrate-binding protein
MMSACNMTRHYIHIFAALGFLTFGNTSSHAAAQQVDAVNVVENLHRSLISVMKEADTLGVQGRYRQLHDPISAAFDLNLMIRIAVGSSWNTATQSERSELYAAFTRLSVSTYASRFDGYSGQTFRTKGMRAAPRGVQLVDVAIESPDDDPVPLTYVLKESSGAWQIVDVLLDTGISELAVRRSEFAAILRQRGTAGLISTLNEKSDELVEN